MNEINSTQQPSEAWVESGRRDDGRWSPKGKRSQVQKNFSESIPSIESSGKRRPNFHTSSRYRRSYSYDEQVSQALAAKTAARYYGECYIQGVGSEAANHAAEIVKDNYRKWWLQKFDSNKASYDDFRGGVGSSHMFNLSPPEHTSPLVEEDDEEFISMEAHCDTSTNVRNSVSTEREEMNPRPTTPYYSVTDRGPNQVGGKVNAVAMVLVKNEEKITTAIGAGTDKYTASPFIRVKNEKKRQFHSFNQNENYIHQRLNVKRDSDDKEDAKEPKVTYERDLNYKQASSFDKFMNKAEDFFHKISDATNGVSNIPYKHTAPETNFTFHQLDEKLNAIIASRSTLNERRAIHTDNAKLSLVHALAIYGGDVKSKEFLFALDQLRSLFLGTALDARETQRSMNNSIEGTWLCLSRPHFKECLGENSAGEYMYTMGRMSFDMFAPTNLVCSIQCVFNSIEQVDVKDISKVLSIPRCLREEVHSGKSFLRTYNIVTAFTIEPDSPIFNETSPNKMVNKALQGLFTVQGYVLPDPKMPNRLSIWFSGGEMVANENNDKDVEEWIKIFKDGSWKRHLFDKARLLAARVLLGAEIPEEADADGTMRFKLNRPIGGHGTAYVDVLYLDETLRVMRGHHGSIFVFSRVSP